MEVDSLESKCELLRSIVLYTRRPKGRLYLELWLPMKGRHMILVKLLIPTEENCKGWKCFTWGLLNIIEKRPPRMGWGSQKVEEKGHKEKKEGDLGYQQKMTS